MKNNASRLRRLKRLKKGYEKFKSDVRELHPDSSFDPFYKHRLKSRVLFQPKHSDTIRYLLSKKEFFGDKTFCFKHKIFEIPKTFSLTENSFNETFDFLRKLFNALYFESFEDIQIDYKNCEKIDVGASMCMDIILADFIIYYNHCMASRRPAKVKTITPINYNKHEVSKILFSIGAYRTIKKINVEFDNITPFPIIIGNKNNPTLDRRREIDITETVNYLISCLKKLNKTLISSAETNFYKVIGEVLQNAEEHSDTNKRFLIGFFEENKNGNHSSGEFSLAILNFGNTIYETFKNAEEPNVEILRQMKDLSGKYTQRGLFRSKRFEEETLWTLYSLQDGVSRMRDWKRGNGAIRFIESFLELKGGSHDHVSKMVIASGHTRIIFDGSYKTSKQLRGKNQQEFKMMTFNLEGNIELPPDENYVRYEDNYFPGTIILVKLKLDSENTETIKN